MKSILLSGLYFEGDLTKITPPKPLKLNYQFNNINSPVKNDRHSNLYADSWLFRDGNIGDLISSRQYRV